MSLGGKYEKGNEKKRKSERKRRNRKNSGKLKII
jgi:hypothetical protein